MEQRLASKSVEGIGFRKTDRSEDRKSDMEVGVGEGIKALYAGPQIIFHSVL